MIERYYEELLDEKYLNICKFYSKNDACDIYNELFLIIYDYKNKDKLQFVWEKGAFDNYMKKIIKSIANDKSNPYNRKLISRSKEYSDWMDSISDEDDEGEEHINFKSLNSIIDDVIDRLTIIDNYFKEREIKDKWYMYHSFIFINYLTKKLVEIEAETKFKRGSIHNSFKQTAKELQCLGISKIEYII